MIHSQGTSAISSTRYIPVADTLASILADRGLTHEELSTETGIPIGALYAPLSLEDAAVVAEALDVELPSLIARQAPPVRFFDDEDGEINLPDVHLLYTSVQFPGEDRIAMLDLDDAHRNSIIAMGGHTIASRLPDLIADWTDAEVAERLDRDPRAVPWMRADGGWWFAGDILRLCTFLGIEVETVFS